MTTTPTPIATLVALAQTMEERAELAAGDSRCAVPRARGRAEAWQEAAAMIRRAIGDTPVDDSESLRDTLARAAREVANAVERYELGDTADSLVRDAFDEGDPARRYALGALADLPEYVAGWHPTKTLRALAGRLRVEAR